MKRWIASALVIALLCVPALAGAQDAQTTVVTVVTNRTTANPSSEVMRRVCALLGVELRITGVADEDYDDRINTLIATGQSPDVYAVNLGNGNLSALSSAATITLGEVMTYMPDVFSTIAQRAAQTGVSVEQLVSRWSYGGEWKGLTTGRYNTSLPYGILIRTDVLDELQEAMPQTITDWDRLLRAYKKLHPDAYPITCANGGEGQMFYMFLCAYGVRRDEWMLVDDQLCYAPFMDGMRDALLQLRSWYADGLVQPDYFVKYMDPDAPTDALVDNDTFFSQYYSLEQPLDPDYREGSLVWRVRERNPSATFAWAPFPTLGEGQKATVANADLFSGYILCFGAHLRDDPEKLHAIMRIYNRLHTDRELFLLQHYGIEGVTYRFDADGVPIIGKAYGTNEAASDAGFYWIHNTFLDACDELRLSVMPRHFIENVQTLIEAPDGLYSRQRLTYIQTPRVNGPLVNADGVNLAKSNEVFLAKWDAMFTGVVIGEKSMEDFDSFIAQWRADLSDEMTELANQLYLAQWLEP